MTLFKPSNRAGPKLPMNLEVSFYCKVFLRNELQQIEGPSQRESWDF
jgi:hypothetical protein